MRPIAMACLLATAALLGGYWLVPSGVAEEERSHDNSAALSYLPPGGVLMAQLPTTFHS